MFSSLQKICRRYSSQVASSPHIPVMCSQVIEYLNLSPGCTVVDMTFGSGGHSKQILAACEDVKIFTLDRDPVAYEYAEKLSQEYPGQVIPLFGRFSDVPKLLDAHDVKIASIDAFLFDFGCSSMQFDEAERGFSISKDGPLDMRMDKGHFEVLTAADIVAKADEDDLYKILKTYGEEKQARKIARAIVEARCLYRIETTKQLANLVASCFDDAYKSDKLKRPAHSATKTFQALRIFVNNELNEINYGMIVARHYLKINGRVVTISFHSLEDTVVKRHLTGNLIQGSANPVPLKYSSYNVIHEKELITPLIQSNWEKLHKHVIVPDEAEISLNPRSRSAKLRAAVKIK